MNNNNFKLGYLHIDKYLSFDNNDLIILTSLNQLRIDLTLNIVSRNNTKCCYISTQKKQHILKEKVVKIEKANSIVDVFEDDLQFTSNTDFIYLEIPTIVELIEEIVKEKDNCDYFVIDGLIFINEYTNPLFSSNKNYQSVLRHLKAVAELIEKPIVLLSALDDSRGHCLFT